MRRLSGCLFLSTSVSLCPLLTSVSLCLSLSLSHALLPSYGFLGRSTFLPSVPPRGVLLSLSRAPGKSSLTVQFVENHFVDSYYPTIENTFTKVIKYKGQDFVTEIIDTAGHVRARSLGRHRRLRRHRRVHSGCPTHSR